MNKKAARFQTPQAHPQFRKISQKPRQNKDYMAFRLGNVMRNQRMGRDLNPRYGYPYAGFQNRCLKPLGHPSGIVVLSTRKSSKKACPDKPYATFPLTALGIGQRCRRICRAQSLLQPLHQAAVTDYWSCNSFRSRRYSTWL